MSDEESLLEANRAFYAAFAGGDYPAMDALWSAEAAVACVHPGWSPLVGREDVMASWESLLRAPPPIRLGPASAFVYGNAAFVLCLELIEETVLSATNIFVREAGGWRLVHHQAGPSHDAAPPDPPPPATSSVH